MNNKPLIVWDFDDVLFPMTKSWFNQVGLSMQGKVKAYENMSENPPHQIMGLSKDDYLQSLDTFRLSSMAQNIKPPRYIQNWFAIYGSAYRNEVLTARPLHTLDAARNWLNTYLPNYFQGFGFVPAPRPGVDVSAYPPTKRAFLEKEGMSPQIFIDDSPATIADVSKMPGVRAILYPAPWNIAFGQNPDPKYLINGASDDQAL